MECPGTTASGQLQILHSELKRCNVKIAGIAETHWRGSGHFCTPDFQVYFSGLENQSRGRVAVMVSSRLRNTVTGYKTDNSIAEIPNNEILGDLNAKIGRTSEDDHLRNVVGKYGIGTRNERGERLLQFCIDNNYCITNTTYKQHIRRLFTWTSPDGRTKNQTDYILIRSRWRTSILSVKTLPGADCGSDHQLLVCGFRIKLQARRGLKQISKLPPIMDKDAFVTTLKRNIMVGTQSNTQIQTHYGLI
ncbi:craniofacial development protein 2-like [Temnothorax longispinosus]|uniref:craniofacial development protein 2-like n=1 Tax=Temnothorax longispinosus TaxID=300112 RepID=UPI003A98D394